MANFFDEERVKCTCGTELFEETEAYMLVKDGNKEYKSVYKKYHRCLGCQKLTEVKENR